MRRFVEEEIKPKIDELEHGDTPPYEVIRKLYRTFGLDALAREGFKRQLERKLSGPSENPGEKEPERAEGGGNAAMTLIPIIELCHYCPGIVTALGVSTGLAAGTIMKSGTPAQMGSAGASTCSPWTRSGPGLSPEPRLRLRRPRWHEVDRGTRRG